MASFNLVLTIPANTIKLQNVVSTMMRSPSTGTITEMVIHIPLGNYAKTPFAFFVEGRQVYPVSGEWIRGNDMTETVEVKIPVNIHDTLELRGLNEDTTDEHTIRVAGSII